MQLYVLKLTFVKMRALSFWHVQTISEICKHTIVLAAVFNQTSVQKQAPIGGRGPRTPVPPKTR
jgi:hypothetical protein